MAGYALRLLKDRLLPNGELGSPLPPNRRVIYVVKGEITINSSDTHVSTAANNAWFGVGPCSVRAGPQGALVWRWELVNSPPSDDGLATGGDVSSIPALASEIDLDPVGSYMMRCDRVDFPLGGIAYTHTHRGPGIRCLLRGELRVTVKGLEEVMRPGTAWFESGPEPVYAAASGSELTSFARGMVLPRELKGKSSISYVRPEDRDKPKTQQYTRFVDEFIEL